MKKFISNTVRPIFKLFKIIMVDYVFRLLNTLFNTLVIIAEKFSSTVFLLCLCITIIFCIDFAMALSRTIKVFKESGGLEISPLIVDHTIYSATVVTYGAKSILKRFSNSNESKLKNTIIEKNIEDLEA